MAKRVPSPASRLRGARKVAKSAKEQQNLVAPLAPKRKGKAVGSGCVGECGPSSTVQFQVKSKKPAVIEVKTGSTSLCPNTGATAWIFVNGTEASRGAITIQGSSLRILANPNDKVVVYVSTYPLFNNIACIRLGELKFEVLQFGTVPIGD